ncbi:GntR family transcriptional regulator [Arsenicitalea aurantiaca]|uniref:GntR family transcriptional regulator n=1 Tax=Arsenicitalea aurantiaca TaxID=1783274 RepID=A0A433X421_9HYPH|nr:GntR family transcriptional regulator [Arsenicitalea aurantiaca]RUT28808.1 GntR family transcriptional regulator [Arsenicitalea aurantiaca]
MKTDTVYKRAFNQALELVARSGAGAPLPSETALAERFAVSRTTVRKVLEGLTARGLVSGAGRRRIVTATPEHADAFPDAETVPTADQVEQRFMEWMLRGDLKPGAHINALDLARQFNVSTTGIREFLNRFARFGLIERRPNARWTFKGMTRDFALELCDIRELFEMRAAEAFIALPEDDPSWARLRVLRADHEALLAELDARFHDFSELDARLHRLINDAADNRFIRDFYDIIAFIFHYHYQWNKTFEKERNAVAIGEHIAYIDALEKRDRAAVAEACRRHLVSARETLLASLAEP